jgi:hypothetical protein
MSKDLVTIDNPDSARGQFLVYEAEDGHVKIDVRLEDETVWLTQQLMADLFQTTKQNISLHIQSIFEEGELAPEATVKKYLTVRREGKREVKRLLDYYNLDMIISVGYRVKSLAVGILIFDIVAILPLHIFKALQAQSPAKSKFGGEAYKTHFIFNA